MIFSNPPQTGDYSEYTKTVLRSFAAAYGITYEMLTADYSNVNFTSGRMAKIDVTGNFRSWQYNMIVPQFCAPVWQWFMDALIMTGHLNEPVGSDWTAPRVQQLDPVRETTAIVMKIKNGLTTISEVIREDGRDPDEFFEEYSQDIERLKELGISIESILGSMASTKPSANI
jgi:capsid protein